jgi:integrase
VTKHNGPGRPNKPTFETSWGEEIEGAYKGKDGKLRPIGRSRPAFSLKDEAKAVMKFRRWQFKQGGSPEPLDDLAITHVADFRNEKDRLRQLILTDPKQAAVELDIPHLAHYPAEPEKPQFTLVQLGEKYIVRKRNKQGKPLTIKHKKNSKKWWSDFLGIIKVRYARDITASMIQDYYDEVMEQFDKGMSPSYVRNRFTKIKAILNWGLQYTDDKIELRRVHDLCCILKSPADTSDPTPISIFDFHKLLTAAWVREKAVLLLGLNCAMHIGEVANTMKSHIDMDSRLLSARRSKNLYPRVAKLWPRTVDAIREYLAAKPHQSEYLFVSRRGKPLTGEALRQKIATIRNRAGLPKTVNFEGLRDAAYGVAETVDAHHAKFIAGHKTGMSDKYVLRQADNPRVVECCEAIERHFFPTDAVSDAAASSSS